MALIKPATSKTSSTRTRPTAQRTTAAVSTSRFEYRAPTAEELRERAQKKGSRDSFFDSTVQFFTPKVGDNTIRILPPPPEKHTLWRSYGVTIYVHYGIGPDEASYLCLDKMNGEACPICEERARAKAAGEEELAQELRPSQRVAVYIIDRDQEGKGPLIWNMPQTIDADICGRSVDKKTGEVYAVDDPESGYDVTFIREGQSLTTKYKSIEIARRSTPLSEDDSIAERWLNHVCSNPIDDKLTYYDYDHIQHALGGIVGPTADNVEKTPTPAKIALRGKDRVEPAAKDQELPTYEELQQMDEETIGALGQELNLTFPDDGFTSLEDLQEWVAKELGIAKPAAEAPTAVLGWRERLRQASSSKK